ncbi:glycosyltransferase [candidate division KSB1 bacterium]|nr:glycosyltransferase [candidate division KSB1 bacterium]
MNGKNKYFFSVIIPSYNRLEEIKELTKSLDEQTVDKDLFEVLIVDDGSTDKTEEWVNNYSKNSSLNTRFIKQDHKGPGAARNLGMNHARGQVFVFIDSDCIAPPNWLFSIKTAFERNSTIDAFGGRDDAHPSFPPLLKAINYSMTSFLFTGGMRGGKKKRLAKFYPRSFNMGIKSELVKKIGGFGTLRHGQDIEFSNRIIKSGAHVLYIQDAVVFHKRRTSLKKFFKQVFNWGVARINLYKNDSAMLEPLHFAPALGFWFVVLFTGFAIFIPSIRPIWIVCAVIAFLLVIYSSLHAAIRWKNITTGLLIPLVICLQISGYGLGFTVSFIRRVILGMGEYTGFVKKYYK